MSGIIIIRRIGYVPLGRERSSAPLRLVSISKSR